MSLPDLAQLQSIIAARRSRRVPGRRRMARSAVAVVLREVEGQGIEVLLMRRAQRAGDPWSGHMSFPGGRMEPVDRATRDTAVRETFEETGLDLKVSGEYAGRLSEVVTRRHERWAPMAVTPHVYCLQGAAVWDSNHEVVELVWVPLDFLVNTYNRERMIWKVGRLRWPLPCYFFEGRRIWGLTLLMLDELLHVWSGRRIRDSFGVSRLPWMAIFPRD